MHFKMYKSGKNWMVAGLMTTAVLAGLTLGNVNATEAHADVNTPVATSTAAQPQKVSQAEYNAQSQKVAEDAAAVANQQKNVNAAQNALDTAMGNTSAAKAVNSASTAFSNAHSDYVVASSNAGVAYRAYHSASNAVDNAAVSRGGRPTDKNMYDQWNRADSAAYAKLQQSVADEQAKLAQAQKDQATTEAAVKSASLHYKELQANVKSAQEKLQADTRANASHSVLDDDNYALDHARRARNLYDVTLRHARKAHTDADQAAFFAYNALHSTNGLLDQLKNLEGHKTAHDRYAKLLATLDQVKAAYQDALRLRDDAKQVAETAFNAYSDARVDNLMPASQPEVDAFNAKAHAAQAQITRLNRKASVQTVANEERAVKGDQSWLSRKQADLKKNQAYLDNATAKLDAAKAALAAATTDAEKTLAQGDVDFWTRKQGEYQRFVNGDKAEVKKAEEGIQYHQDKLAKAKADPDYIATEAKIAELNQVVEDAHIAQQNYADFQESKANLTELQNRLNAANQSLSALTDIYNRDKGVLDNMVVNGQTPVVENGTFGNVTLGHGEQLPANPTFNPEHHAATVAVLGSKVVAATEGTTGVKAEWDNYAEAQQMVADARAEANKTGHAVVVNIPAHYNDFHGTVKVTVLPDVTNPNTDQPSDNNQGSTTENTNKSEGSFTGVKNGEHFVNGKKVSAAQYNAYVAAHKGAVKKSAAKAAAKKLPQTGNNSAAVVALGALSGMLGLGLAAKKREF